VRGGRADHRGHARDDRCSSEGTIDSRFWPAAKPATSMASIRRHTSPTCSQGSSTCGGFAHRRSHALELVRGRHSTRVVKPPNRRKCYARKSSRLSKGARGAPSVHPLAGFFFCASGLGLIRSRHICARSAAFSAMAWRRAMSFGRLAKSCRLSARKTASVAIGSGWRCAQAFRSSRTARQERRA
jgi:hypothetical protein